MKPELFTQILEKYLNIEYYEIPSSGHQLVPCGQTDRQVDGRTDMTKPIVAFRKFSNVPKK
jgi:hypothetical protein